MYRLDVTIPIIPLGGEIQVIFDSSKINANSGAHCRVKTNFVRPTDNSQVMRCFWITGGFRITGFNAMSTATPISMYFMVTSITALTAENIAVNLYGIFSDSTSSIAMKTNAVTITHPASSFPSLILRHLELKEYQYSSIYN